MTHTDVEARTREIGHAIFAHARESRDGTTWLDSAMMDLGMRDERVKAQLFRFVDVLPALSSPSQANRLLRQYLEPVSDRLPSLIAQTIRHLPDDGWLGARIGDATRWGVGRMARRFIAAGNVDEAIRAVTRLRRERLAFTIDLVGEAILSAAEAIQYQQRYLELIRGLADAARDWPDDPLLDRDHRGRVVPRVNVSLKLSSLFSQFDPIDPDGTSKSVRARLRPILQLARETGSFVNFDMEQYSYRDVTLRIFRDVLEEADFRDWPDVGIAIQAYLKDSCDDVVELARWAGKRGTPVWVRLVKGAYWDYETTIAAQNGWPVPVFTAKPQSDASFESLTDFLLEVHETLRPAIASHNIRSLAHAIASAEAKGVPPAAVEFQMLHGMAGPIASGLVDMNRRVRVYTPMGELLPGMAYLVRRLLENTSNESFLRAGFLENVPEEQLLMKPMLTRHEGTMPRRYEGFNIEPLTDFSREENRAAMARALAEVAGQLGQSYPLVIGGRAIETSATIESVNPSHRTQVVGRVARATADHARDAIAAAKRAFPMWRATPPRQRADLLRRAAAIMRRRRFELAAWEVFETAKQWREADADVAEAIDYCDYYAAEMIRLAKPQRRDVPGEENEYFYEPRGVTVTIAPWNFPLAILCGMTTAALVTGNTVIMKPAEQSPVIAAMLMQVLDEAGFPSGVVNYLPGVGEEVGPVLVNHPDVATIAFTGSRAVGLAIQEQASRTPSGQTHVKRVITEMGGKNAAIVDETADLDEAVHGVVASAFGYAGQKCSACSRAVVVDSVYDAFLSRLVEATRSLNVGPAADPKNFVGPVIDAEARDRIAGMVAKGKQEAKLVYGGEVPANLADEGFFFAPHVFADAPPDASIAQEEIFGPVLAVIRARDLTDALNIANGTAYALTGGIFSRSPANLERVRREFVVGNLYINRKITGALVDRQPFGGFKLSGVGSKAGGPDYLQQFMVPRVITENTLRRGFAPTASGTDEATAGK